MVEKYSRSVSVNTLAWFESISRLEPSDARKKLVY